jgi:hypothetical protein
MDKQSSREPSFTNFIESLVSLRGSSKLMSKQDEVNVKNRLGDRARKATKASKSVEGIQFDYLPYPEMSEFLQDLGKPYYVHCGRDPEDYVRPFKIDKTSSGASSAPGSSSTTWASVAKQ